MVAAACAEPKVAEPADEPDRATGASPTERDGERPTEDAGLPPDGASTEPRDPLPANEDEPINPLRAGYTWTYLVKGASAACPPGRHTAEAKAHANACGVPVVELTSMCARAKPASYLYYSDGDATKVCIDGKLTPTYGLPVAEGTTWTYYGAPYRWIRAGQVTVPAGTFDDCWTMKEDSDVVLYEATYCRGVGLVRMRQLQAQVDLDVQLEKKSF